MRKLLLLILLTGCSEITIDACFTNCTGFMEAYIRNHDVGCAFYDIDHPRIIQALDNTTVFVDENTHSPGIKINGSGLMHHKFCTDGRSVLTGSTNPTLTGLHNNDNSMLIVHSPEIARIYARELELLTSEHQAQHTRIDAEDITIDAHICHNTCIDVIVQELREAQTSIDFMIFTFTHRSVLHGLAYANLHNITVRGVLESRSASHDAYHFLRYQGIDVCFDANPAVMHHKVFIVDNRTVIMGSFNPTKNADTKNHENLLIIQSEEVAGWYMQEFTRLYRAAIPLRPSSV